MLSEIKLSPLLLFFTLLIVLVIATTVKRWGLVSEGFIGYLKDANSFSSQTVPAYDSGNAIIKLYDDIFFDYRNGNAVIITASPYVNTEDTTGASVSSIDVIPRKMNPIYTYTRGSDNAIMSQQCAESKVTTIKSLETQWSVKGLQSTNQLTYITWGNDTYLYVIDLANASMSGNTTTVGSYRPAVSAYFNGKIKESTNSYTESDTINLKPAFTYTSNGKDDTNVVVDFYDKVKTVFQVLSDVWFDVKNGNLLVKTNGTGAKLDVFVRGSKTSSYSYTATATENTTPASKVSFSKKTVAPYFIQDATGNHTIMYLANDNNTILSVFKNTLESNGMVIVTKCHRFTRNGLYIRPPASDTPAPGTPAPGTPAPGTPAPAVDVSENSELLDSFARWYIYFNTNAVGSTNSNDYLLKTQIVPPVCPACPGCQNQQKGVCTDCGGKGGSGTQTTDSSSLAFNNKTVVGATGSAVANTVDAVGNVAEKTVNVAGNVAEKTLDVAGNVAGKTLDTAGNVVGKTFDAAGNLLGSTASALGLDRIGYKQSYGGPTNTSSSANVSGYPSNSKAYRPGSNTTGVPNYPNSKPNDPYSYNGALQSKGGNFMAITTDFSKFGR